MHICMYICMHVCEKLVMSKDAEYFIFILIRKLLILCTIIVNNSNELN